MLLCNQVTLHMLDRPTLSRSKPQNRERIIWKNARQIQDPGNERSGSGSGYTKCGPQVWRGRAAPVPDKRNLLAPQNHTFYNPRLPIKFTTCKAIQFLDISRSTYTS